MPLNMDFVIPGSHTLAIIGVICPFFIESLKNTAGKIMAIKGMRIYAGERISSNYDTRVLGFSSHCRIFDFQLIEQYHRTNARNTIVLPIVVWTTYRSYTRTDPWRSPSMPVTKVTIPFAKVRKAPTIAALWWLNPQHEVLFDSEILLIGVLDDAMDDFVSMEISRKQA